MLHMYACTYYIIIHPSTNYLSLLSPAKKNLAPSAVAGLAMKLDLSTVQLRKTGISDKMLMERSADITKDLPNLAVGAEYDTKHTTMLLQIKGQSSGGCFVSLCV